LDHAAEIQNGITHVVHAERRLARARSVATLLDSSIPIPGTTRRIGLDPILGLIPFVGDFAGALFSGYIVLVAAQAGVPTFTLIRMVGNIALDTIAGSLPILGDFFDAAWKSNDKNVSLFEKYVVTAVRPGRTSPEVYKLGGIILVVSSLLAILLLTFVAALLILLLKHALFGG
jgi:hypothetical protein